CPRVMRLMTLYMLECAQSQAPALVCGTDPLRSLRESGALDALCRSTGAGRHEPVDRGAHLVQIGEIAVDGSKADVGDGVQVARPFDHQLADRRARPLSLPEIVEPRLHVRHQRVDLRLAHGPLRGSDADGVAQLARIVLFPPRIL